MSVLPHVSSWAIRSVPLALVSIALNVSANARQAVPESGFKPSATYAERVRPLLKKYCLNCHSTKLAKGSLDLERFLTADDIRKDLKPWQSTVEMLEADEMPPKSKPQPTAEERMALVEWIRAFLHAEARARDGDPGRVPLRRLSNAEYDATIRDLTGVDLKPTKQFPADGAGGEGFTNASEALTEVSPALLTKYLNAAKEIAERAVLLPDGFRFSPSSSRRDWTDESLMALRRCYTEFSPDGVLPLQTYLAATIRNREALLAGKIAIAEVAARDKLNAKYLGVLWAALTSETPSFPLDAIRSQWKVASERDVGSLTASIKMWQAALWKTVRVGSYIDGNTSRQVPQDPIALESRPFRINVVPKPGQSEVTLYLTARSANTSGEREVSWLRPRFEGGNLPTLLLKDYSQYGSQYEADLASIFDAVPKYLAAAVEALDNRQLSPDEIARKSSLDAAFLKRWIELLALQPFVSSSGEPDVPGRVVPAVELKLLEERVAKSDDRPAISGWKAKGADLPVVVANSSDKVERIPGTIPAHALAVHPTPNEFVAAVWKSPMDGRVSIDARIVHAHPACGNGVAWWLEHRRGNRATLVAEGALDLGKEFRISAKELKIAAGDIVLLAVDARDGNHVCDLTEIALTVAEREKPCRKWDLAADVADSILEGNPHGDKHGNMATWSFVRGPAKPSGINPGNKRAIPVGSVLDRWRDAATNPAKRAEAVQLAEEVRKLLIGARPANEKSPDGALYDSVATFESPLLKGLGLTTFRKSTDNPSRLGIPAERFGRHREGQNIDDASLMAKSDSVTELRLPAAIFSGRSFIVDGCVNAEGADTIVQFQVSLERPKTPLTWDGNSPLTVAKGSAAHTQLLRGLAQFRECFPLYVCYPHVIPLDEVVCLKLFHREDEPLKRLFLNAEEAKRLDSLWEEHRFISQWPITEQKNLPLFIGFVTQDQPKALVEYFEGMREPFRLRAEAFARDLEAAAPKQLEMLLRFTARAYRRPLDEGEKSQLSDLYGTLRKKGSEHEEAFRSVLARVLVSPAFLFRIEHAPPGKEPAPVSDGELATRLSYFLWSSLPDGELEQLAAAGKLRDPNILAVQAARMVRDKRVRSLAIEFGTQWIHVRGFDEFNEKNEKLFPTFDTKLRRDMYEESIAFFQYLFEADRPFAEILGADYALLNANLAKHYGIPGVEGDHFRRVDGVRKYGRGGVLGLASVQSAQAGASRTSPVLRGNWVVETLLGEKLPRPPANVPRLPEEEGQTDGLTVRQLVEKHASQAECAVCHRRIDPFGFALEKFDPIGRLREKDLGGLTIDAAAKLKDGTEFVGIEGLRSYLLGPRKAVVQKLFCRRLLGYALGRGTTLSDEGLLDRMTAALDANGGKLSAAIEAIVRSPQFRNVRGSGFEE